MWQVEVTDTSLDDVLTQQMARMRTEMDGEDREEGGIQMVVSNGDSDSYLA